MKKRYLYAFLWGVPGGIAAGIGAGILVGMLAGVLWLYVFGDNAWPSSMGFVLAALGIVAFLASWIGLIVRGYRLGKRLENEPGQNWKHILLSVGLTLSFLLYILLQQASVGNLGPKSDSVRCSDFCVQRGYSGNGMPPADSEERICSCYDDSGREAIQVPLADIDSDASK